MIDWAIGLSTGCFYRTPILECLDDVRRAGFTLIEICSFPAHLDYHDDEMVRRAADRIEGLGLVPYSMHAPFADNIDITSLDDDDRAQSEGELIAAVEAAARLGVRYLVLHPGPERAHYQKHQRIDRMENAAAVLSRIAQRCSEHGMHLVLENMLPHLFAGHVRNLLWILGALERTDVGVCLDTGHAYLTGDLHTVVHKLSGHLWMVHASDNHGKYDDHLPPGEGNIDWHAFVRKLSRVGFAGALILEIAGDTDMSTVLERARHSARYLRRACHSLHGHD